MSLTKSAARTRMRYRLKDTATTYEFSDTLVDTYLAPALKEIAVAVRSVDPSWYLRSHTIVGYTNALDPVASGEQGYEFHALPPTFAAWRWGERIQDGVVQYRLREVGATDQEAHRFNGNLGFTRVEVSNGSTYNLSPAVGRETVSIHGNKVRIVPPPTSETEYRIWFDADPETPSGESEALDIPAMFEESLVRAWAFRVLADSDDAALAAVQEKALARELAIARKAHGSRTGRNLTVGQVW